MVNAHHLATLIHEIEQLRQAIRRFCEDADARSDEVVFDIAAILQWGSEVVARVREIEAEELPAPPSSSFTTDDPLYLRALRDARSIHEDAETIDRELSICLAAMGSLDDPGPMWAAVPHLEHELEQVACVLRQLLTHVRASVELPTDS